MSAHTGWWEISSGFLWGERSYPKQARLPFLTSMFETSLLQALVHHHLPYPKPPYPALDPANFWAVLRCPLFISP